MDKKPNTNPTEQWKGNTKRDNRQKGNKWKNGYKSKDASANGKICKKFVGTADSDALKGKVITAEGDNWATQYKELMDAALTYFGTIDEKARQSIYDLTKLKEKDLQLKRPRSQNILTMKEKLIKTQLNV